MQPLSLKLQVDLESLHVIHAKKAPNAQRLRPQVSQMLETGLCRRQALLRHRRQRGAKSRLPVHHVSWAVIAVVPAIIHRDLMSSHPSLDHEL